jgi:hypothetical protein
MENEHLANKDLAPLSAAISPVLDGDAFPRRQFRPRDWSVSLAVELAAGLAVTVASVVGADAETSG